MKQPGKISFWTHLAICAVLIGCSSKPIKDELTPVVTVPVKEPECLPGCFPNIDDVCVTIANVSDGAMVEQEEVECAARCCEEGFNSAGPDRDGDGLLDDEDQCPDEPEDRDEFQDKDGCPDPDNDGDGILDIDDLCALDAEDVDGFQDSDGCPD